MRIKGSFYRIWVCSFLAVIGISLDVHAMNKDQRDESVTGYYPFAYNNKFWHGNQRGKLAHLQKRSQILKQIKEQEDFLKITLTEGGSLTPQEDGRLKQRLEKINNVLEQLKKEFDDAQSERRIQLLELIKKQEEELSLIESKTRVVSKDEQTRFNDKTKAIKKSLEDLFAELSSAELTSDSKYGKAIASGLAGKDWEALQDEHIKDVWEGAKLGGLIRVSRACSDVLGKRIENSIDRVLGGAWDSFISAIIDGWTMVCEVLFHSGEDPFTAKQLKGWQSLVQTTFGDVDRLLKDGFKDSLRGHDMTLRQAGLPEEEEQEQQPIITAWQMLISGYIRQFEHIILQLEKHLVYYNDDETIGFYAIELKERLKETNKLLIQAGSLKELDNLIESNKSLILGLKNNILNLFARLLEIIEQPAGAASASSSSSMRDASRRNMDGMRSGMDEESAPRSFRGGF